MENTLFKNSIIRAVVALLVGIFLVVCPGFVAGSLVAIIGAVILLSGIASIVQFFRVKRDMSLVSGIVGVIAGLVLLFRPDFVLAYVMVVLALVLFVFAVEEIVRLAKMKVGWPFFVLPVALAVLGIIILCQPVEAMKLAVTLFGAAIIVYAVSEFVTAYKIKKFYS